ncbi:MAG: SAM-dependent methyltransferase/DNA-directed RNA polymerase subunit RPC12/RpoP [Bacteriovoracaceae bacterium]|jgi:SAM-dependent methyltransferase/DNA-directed RNA polymerase subunit RPC12/RpoP
MKISKIIEKNLFKCITCDSAELEVMDESLSCPKCGSSFMKNNSKVYFESLEESEAHTVDSMDMIKTFFKKYHSFYKFLRYIIGPMFLTEAAYSFLLKHKKEGMLAVNLGSGNTELIEGIINIDLIGYDRVHIVADITNIPLKDNSVDLLVIDSVLEHVPYPIKVVEEIHRVLKKGGLIYSSTPFMMPFHASPYDFNRWTYEGVKILFEKFEMVSITSEGGPVSTVLWALNECLSTIFSLGNKHLFNLISILIMLLTWPIKYLDFIFNKFETSRSICTAFIFVGKK